MRTWKAGALLALAACGASESGPVPSDPEPDLASSLSVSVDDSVRLRIDVTNMTSEPIVLDFATAQRVDFAVLDEAGQEVWRWSDGMGYAQMLGQETVAVGATVSWSGSWSPADLQGTFDVVGAVVSTSHPVELRTRFELLED